MIEMLFQDDSDYLFHQFHLHLVQHIPVQFNPQKTKNIVFSRRGREHLPVYVGLNGDEIDEIDNHCHLGITFQSSAEVAAAA
jgi:hypothetical protein